MTSRLARAVGALDLGCGLTVVGVISELRFDGTREENGEGAALRYCAAASTLDSMIVSSCECSVPLPLQRAEGFGAASVIARHIQRVLARIA